MNIKYFIIPTVIAVILIVIYESRYYILWFLNTLKVTLINKKNIETLQKKRCEY